MLTDKEASEPVTQDRADADDQEPDEEMKEEI